MPVESSGLALKASSKRSNACIAHESFANANDLKVVKKNIEDQKNNTTRFIILGKSSPLRVELIRLQLSFLDKNRPGLYQKFLKFLNFQKLI